MYLYVNSKQYKFYDLTIHKNTGYDFMIELPRTLELQGEWSCAVLEVSLEKPLTEILYLYCDIIENSLILGKPLPLLRSFQESIEYAIPVYVPVIVDEIKRINFKIRDIDDKKSDIKIDEAVYMIHLKKV